MYTKRRIDPKDDMKGRIIIYALSILNITLLLIKLSNMLNNKTLMQLYKKNLVEFVKPRCIFKVACALRVMLDGS